MYTMQPKKMLIMNILDILRRYTDVDHRLSQTEIINFLKADYDMKADRKAVKRNLMNLADYGYNISFSESIRTNRNGDEEIIYSDWYMIHDFDDSELRLVIDSLLFSKHIPYTHCKDLIEKIEGLSNIYFKAKVKHIACLNENKSANSELFFTIKMLDEAISKGRKVCFEYCSYDVDKTLHSRKNDDGEIRKYIVNPYQMVATEGRYYLVCNYDKYDDISNYRVDRIKNIQLLDESVKPMKLVKGLEDGLNLETHIAEHIHMFSGERMHVKFRSPKYLIDDILDQLGTEVRFSDVTENEMSVHVTASENAMYHWALQYCDHIEILEPKKLRERVYDTLKGCIEKYSK